MTAFVLRAVFAALGLWLATEWVDGIAVDSAATLLMAGLLLGVVNATVRPLLMLLTLPLALFTLAISGFLMWRRRRPDSTLGAPPAARDPAKLKGVAGLILILAALLPLLAASLILLWIVERLLLPRLPRAARWLGVAAKAPARL